MARMNLSAPKSENAERDCAEVLTELVPIYAANKLEMDSYKKLCDKESAEIKSLLEQSGENKFSVDTYTVTRVVSTRDSLNEEHLMAVLKKYNVPGVIKTREYVDTDALEDYLYQHTVSSDLAAELAECHTSTEVVSLRLTQKKGAK